MERPGPLEGVLDARQPGSRDDTPSAIPRELLGQTSCTVDLALPVTSAEEALEFLPSELPGIASACNV